MSEGSRIVRPAHAAGRASCESRGRPRHGSVQAMKGGSTIVIASDAVGVRDVHGARTKPPAWLMWVLRKLLFP